MKGRRGASSKLPHKRAVQKVDVEMENIKFVCPPPHFFKHDHVVRQRVHKDRVEAKSHIATTDQVC